MTIASTPSLIISGNGLSYPWGVTFDSSGKLWVSSSLTNNIYNYASNGVLIKTISTGSYPLGLTIDPAENLWVANYFGNSIQKISSSSGAVILNLPTLASLPTGVAIDNLGNVWVSSVNTSGLIEKYSGTGGFAPAFSTGGSNSIYDLEFDNSGNLWVSDFGQNNVKEFSIDGTLLQTLSAGVSNPVGISFDHLGNLWVANYGNKTIQQISVDGDLKQTISTGSSHPVGLAFDSSGDLWVSYYESSQVVEFLQIPPSPPTPHDSSNTITINGQVLTDQTVSIGSAIALGATTLKISGVRLSCHGGAAVNNPTNMQVAGDISAGLINTQSPSIKIYKNYITDFIGAASAANGGTAGYNCAYLSNFEGNSNFNVISFDNNKNLTNCLDLVNNNSSVTQNVDLTDYKGIAIITNGISVNSKSGANTIGMLGGTCNFAAGDHKVYIMAPNCSVNGGEGITTVEMYSVSREQASFAQYGNYLQLWSDWLHTGNGVTNLSNVQRIQFSDGAIAFDTDVGENAGEAYRLYQAAFSRTPDLQGFGYWISQLDHGAELTTNVAQSFVNSKEFQQTYGLNISNDEFINLLYINVLHRNADQSGLDYWNTQMAQGQSRASVLVNFSESSENVDNTGAALLHGTSYQVWVG